MKKIDEVIICQCNSPDHNIIIRYVEDEPEHFNEVYVNVHITTGGFFDRLKKAWQYLIYGTSKYGEYDEIVLPADDETIKKLNMIVRYLKKTQKNGK